MNKQFKPVIKHDEVTQTYTIRDKHGVVIQVPDTLIDRLDSQYSELETQKTALARSYKQVVEENKGLRKDNLELYELLQDFSEFINYKLFISPSSSNYRHYRSELDKLGVK